MAFRFQLSSFILQQSIVSTRMRSKLTFVSVVSFSVFFTPHICNCEWMSTIEHEKQSHDSCIFNSKPQTLRLGRAARIMPPHCFTVTWLWKAFAPQMVIFHSAIYNNCVGLWVNLNKSLTHILIFKVPHWNENKLKYVWFFFEISALIEKHYLGLLLYS